MKQFFLLLLAFFAFGSLSAQKEKAEQDAIRKVIEMETKHYFDGNYDKWSSTWAHEPTSYVILSGPNGNSETMGWDKISAEVKPTLKNVALISAEELANSYKKYDYQYKIDGNLANVNFREGKGNFLTKTLERQNGEWKITGMTVVYSTDYAFKESFTRLKSYVGKWKLVEGSYKNEATTGSDDKYKMLSNDYDIRETTYGIEFTSTSAYTYSGKPNSTTVTETFIPDNGQNKIKYFDFERSSTGNVSTSIGNALYDTSGKFVVKGMYSDKPDVVQFENIYTTNGDGSIHHEGRSYDKDGKLTFKWFFDLRRV